MTPDCSFAVTWEYCGARYLLDVDDRHDAFALAIALAEQGRADVRITRVPLEVDAEVRERIRRRIAERLRAEGAAHADA